MNINFKDLGIGSAIGAGVAALAINTPKLANKAKEKVKAVKLDRSLKRKKKVEESANSTPEEK